MDFPSSPSTNDIYTFGDKTWKFNGVAWALQAAESSGASLNDTLTALSELDATAGLVEQTGADTFTKRLLGVTNSTDVPTRSDADSRYAALSHATAAITSSGHTMATSRLLGRTTASSGAIEELTAASVKTLLAIANTDVSGLGTAATVNTGTSGGTIPLLNGTNSWSALQSFSSAAFGLTGLLKGNGSSATTAVTGTNNYLPKWSSNSLTGTSMVYDTGTQLLIGTNTNYGGEFNPSRVFIWGGTNGANVDIMGEAGNGDQATVDLQSSNFSTNFKSVYLQYSNHDLADSLGQPQLEMGRLIFACDYAQILSTGAVPILFGTDSIARWQTTALGHVAPASNDGVGLGTSSLSWSDLFLASGGVINFNNGNYTLTHSSGALTASGTLAASNLSGTNTGDQTITLTGDVTGTGTGSFATTIGSNKVTLGMMAQVSTATFLGRTTASTGNVESLTATQATALLDTFTSGAKGLTPASGGGTTNFLRADGTWAAPGSGVSDGDKGDITVSASGSTWTVDNDVISYAKIQNVSAASRVLGRGSAGGSGDTEELTVGTGLTISGSTIQTNGAYTVNGYTMTTSHLLGRTTASSGAAEEISVNSTLSLSSGTLGVAALGTPSSGTLTNCSGLPISGLTSSTSTALGVGSIELGHATDTTISRASAGDINVEGNVVYRAGGTDVPVTDGGTGRSTLTTAYGLLAAGTTATGAIQTLAAGATTEILVGGGASALPVWTTATGTGAPVRAGSPTFTGTVTTAASTTGGAGFNLPHGSAPTSPTNGDIWTTTTALLARINGTTKTMATTADLGTAAAKNIHVGTSAPGSPSTGDLWVDTN